MDTPQSKNDETALPRTLVASEAFILDASSFHTKHAVASRYEIRTKLGEGGAGEVWHAFDLKLRVDVALKSIRIDRKQKEDSVEALRREVRNAREVTSPNVCRIYDLVTAEDHELISMEYVDGTTLMELLIQRGPLELQEAREIAAQFLAGLESIHQAGLVHHDLKPENIMITRTGRVVVMDLGIAKHAAQMEATISGTLPYMSPEQLSGDMVDARSDLYSVGIILAEMIHPQKILTENTRADIWNAVREDPSQLADSPWKAVITRAVAFHPNDRFASAGALSRALEEVTQRVDSKEERKPYPGLASFTTADSEYFFGREMEVENVIKKLKQLHLMAVVGSSGAGKTSFLRAGLIPSLPTDWKTIFCVPGDSPFLNLEQASMPDVSGRIESPQITQPNQLDRVLQMLLDWRNKHTEVVLIIDRFEELFTLNGPEVQSRFTEFIGKAALESDIRVLLSMRDDFLLRCHHYSYLAPIFSELTPLETLTGPALRRALLQPALKSGYRFEDDLLVDQILADVEKERGALPLMAFAAAQLWEKRDRHSGKLTREAYRQIGGVAGALARHAEDTLNRIGLKREPIVREMFHNLITSQNTRAARDTEELLSVFPEKQVAEEVLRGLIDARLLTSFEAPHEKGKQAEIRIEIIHESLLSAWPRLVRWQTQDAGSAQLRDQLRQAAQLWEQRNRSEDLLWTGSAFLEFQAWRQRYPGGLTNTEEEFSHAMNQRAYKKRKQRRIVVFAMFAALLSILAAISFLLRRTTIARDEAVRETRRAEAGTVLSAGRAISEANPTTKLAYAIASLELTDSPQARRFALQALSEGPPAYALEMSSPLATVQWSPDNKWIAVGGQDGRMQLVSRDGSPPLTIEEPFRAGHFIPWNPQFSPDSQYLIWTSRKDPGIVNVWSLSQKKLIRTFHMGGITICLVRGGKAFLITDTSGRRDTPFKWDQTVVRIWRFDSGEPEAVGRLSLGGNFWKNFDIDSRGRWLAYKKGQAVYHRLLDGSGFGSEKLIGTHTAETDVIKFHPILEEIASSDANGEIRVWSVNIANHPVRVVGGIGERINLWFSSKGTFLFTERQGKLLAWELTSARDAEPLLFTHLQEDIKYVTVDPEDRLLCVAGGSSLLFYPLGADHPYVIRNNGYPSNIRFTPDGKSLIGGFEKDGIRVWNMPGEKQNGTRTLWSSKQWNAESIDLDPLGKFVLAALLGDGVHLISLFDGKDLLLKSNVAETFQFLVTYSPDGNSAAAAGTNSVEVWDLKTGKSRILVQSKGKRIGSLKYSRTGALFATDTEGTLYQWNPNSDSSKVLGKGKGMISGIAISNDGRYVAASTWSARTFIELQRATSELVIYDLKERKSFPLSSHGNRVFSIAFDPSGTKLISGDFDGIVRVGQITGETPHLLLGHKDPVRDVIVHPGGQWLASVDYGSVVRLWQMPEGKPLDSFVHHELLNRLRRLTNVRAVVDKNSATGYGVEYSAFPGWGKLLAHSNSS